MKLAPPMALPTLTLPTSSPLAARSAQQMSQQPSCTTWSLNVWAKQEA